MILKVVVGDQTHPVEVPEQILDQGEEFFARMDRDMDRGWQMSREWVEHPDRADRCKIAASRLLTALENENSNVVTLMAGYILSRMPETTAVEIDTSGEMQDTRLLATSALTAPEAPPASAPMSKMEALERAGREISKVFKVGKGYRFSTYDQASGQWVDSPLLGDSNEAERLRMRALRERYEELTAAK